MPPRARARIDRPPPKDWKERVKREIEEQGKKAVMVFVLAGVLVFMVGRLYFAKPEVVVPRPRPGSAAASAPAAALPVPAPPPVAPSPAAPGAGAQRGVAASAASNASIPTGGRPYATLPAPVGPLPATVADAEAVAARLEHLAARLERRTPSPLQVLPDPFDHSAIDAAEARARDDAEARARAAEAAARDTAAVVAAFTGRLSATYVEIGVAVIDGRDCRVGESAGLYEVAEVGPGYAVLRSPDGVSTLRLVVWKEQQDLGRYIRPLERNKPVDRPIPQRKAP